ncbi:hypothetical protein Tco_0625968 [Tanacetum coccineum]|uniref:Uncharacterized protein n=1 Tax=Tanacetum coccineum TaxID=301880 RepID=A0ABQ4WJ20_9ASTR
MDCYDVHPRDTVFVDWPRLGDVTVGNQRPQGYREPDLVELASAIIISSDSSDESVGSPPSRVILFGDILTVIPSTYVVAPETSTIAPVISSDASFEHISRFQLFSPLIWHTISFEAPDSYGWDHHADPYLLPLLALEEQLIRLILDPSRLEMYQPRLCFTLPEDGAPRCSEGILSLAVLLPFVLDPRLVRADLSPPRKRFRDSYSSEASIEEDAEVGLAGMGVDMELGIGDGDEVGDHVEIDHGDARDDTEEYEAVRINVFLLKMQIKVFRSLPLLGYKFPDHEEQTRNGPKTTVVDEEEPVGFDIKQSGNASKATKQGILQESVLERRMRIEGEMDGYWE